MLLLCLFNVITTHSECVWRWN